MSTNSEPKRKPWEERRLPHIGQRIFKTSFAVFLCLIIYHLRGFHGEDMPTEAAITAIICMQPYVRDTRDYAFNRLTSTLIGAGLGLGFLLLLLFFPSLGANHVLLYALMAFGVLASLYAAVALGKPDSSGLAAIIFLCLVISFPDIEEPLKQALNRLIDLFIGTAVAIGVNVFRLPRDKKPAQVFFVRARDLVPDRFSQIAPAVLYKLNALHDDGARICLMSEHAPAFFLLQMSAAKLNLPMIVMDGAALYDANENRYLEAETIPAEDSEGLRARLDALGLSYFIYTIHRDKTCIFHRGALRAAEKTIYDRLKSSPYRSYLEGEIYDLNEIVYFKVIAADEEIAEMEYHLRHTLPRGKLRAVIRPQSAPGISGLYIYAHSADMDQAKKRLMLRLRAEDPALESVELRLRAPYRSEHDAMHLLTLLGNRYEPIRLFSRLRKRVPQEQD